MPGASRRTFGTCQSMIFLGEHSNIPFASCFCYAHQTCQRDVMPCSVDSKNANHLSQASATRARFARGTFCTDDDNSCGLDAMV